MKKTKILLYGIGTFKNRGIEAILQSTINQIDKKKYEIDVATFDYNENKKKYTDNVTKYINHYKKHDELTEEEKELEEKYKNMPFDYNNFELLYQNEVVKELDDMEICFSTGGDNYCYEGCNWLYALDNLSNKLGKKTVLWGASLFEKIEDKLLINDLQNFDVLVIRESLTYNEVKKYIPEERLILSSDPAFSLEVKETKISDWYKNRNYIVLNVSPLTILNDNQYKEVIDFINYILKETKYSICLLPHVQTEDCNDLDILEKLKNEFEDEDRIYLEAEDYNCNELKYIISKSKIAVVARTHASIAAYSTLVPTLVIGYSVKSKGIAKDIFGTFNNYVISKDDLKDGELIKHFKYIDDNKNNIKKVLEEKMPDYKKQAKNLFNTVTEKLEEQEKLKICNRGKCIGCGLCSKECPKNAIEMVPDKYGFVRPKIDLKKCIHCDICRKKCPINREDKSKKYEMKYYAAKSKDKESKKKSSSGGIFSVLAEKVLKDHGIVYGCQMKDFKLNHVRIDNIKDLDKIRGSKYAQSRIDGIYDLVKKDLDSNKKVLFSGTPCQIGALKAFLNKDYDNLITASVICHGVTSEKIFHKQIEEIEKEENKKVLNVNFKSKANGWSKASIEYDFEDSRLVNKFLNDSFMNLYLKNVILRDSCYQCKYKDNNNLADLILGDYWGIEVVNKEFFDDDGITLLIINSSKGEKFIDKKVLEKIEYTDGSYEDTLKYNPLLFESCKEPVERTYILSKIDDEKIFNLNVLYLYNKLNKDNKALEEERNYLRANYEAIHNEIDAIKGSRRYRVANKVGNVVNKFRRRKEK